VARNSERFNDLFYYFRFRYYSVWKEENHLFIQNEYCDGGPIAEIKNFDQKLLVNMWRQILEVSLLKILFHYQLIFF